MISARTPAPAVPLILAIVFLASGGFPAAAQRADPGGEGRNVALAFTGDGHTFHGDWHAEVSLTRDTWHPGTSVRFDVNLRFAETHLAGLASAGIKADKLCLLVTAERTFDANGWMRLPSDERMSTLLTPTGLAIEGGVQGAVTNRYGYQYKSPLDQLLSIPISQVRPGDIAGTRMVTYGARTTLPANLPPGLYRLRFDLGVMVGTRVYNFNGFTFASRPFSDQVGTSTYFYSPVIPASGADVSGRQVDGHSIQARFPWRLLASYNSNGYRGVVADEDSRRFATSDRSLIPDDVILPMFSDAGSRLSYSLEPQFPADSIDSLLNIAWDYASGQYSVKIYGPDNSVVDLGTATFVAKSGNGATTKNAAFTTWRPQSYGQYRVSATGWIADQSGRRYEGGGTYRFWIAKRMTLATATFQGMPYPVGSTYGRDIQFNPAVPADVKVTADLYVNSDPNDVRTLSYSGKASTAGIFGAAQGMKSFPLNAPGEYHARVLATYTDPEGHLWVSTMRHAGIVYPEPSPVIARGKKLSIGGKYVDRGEKKFEGYIEPDGTQHLDHITFPYLAGDVLLIGAEGQGANKIEPVLIYQKQGDNPAWDTTLNGVGTTNLRIKTSNGYSPHLFPEYITDIEYYYGAAPRPGFMGRFIVGESTVRAPYWPVSPNSFGGQIGASPNGDAPGDIYRLIGGVVLRPRGQPAMYSGYIASAFLLAKGTNNNRVVAPGSEDLNGPLGEKARFYLVGLRPGTALEVGGTFRPAVQIDPLLPVSIRFTLTYPDGREQVATGTGDRFGSFAGPTAWPLDVPGVYRYQLRATWNGFEGRMPGLPDSGGEFYVFSKTRPAGAVGLRIDGATTRTFSATMGVTLTGSSGASSVHYSLITPGAVIEIGDVPVRNGRFTYTFDPVAVNRKVPLYDIVSITSGKPQIGRVIHLTFFSEEKGAGGAFSDFARVILRGTTAITARAIIPTVVATLPASVEGTLGALGAEVSRGAVRITATDTGTVRAWEARVDQLVRDGELRVVSREDDTVLAGRSHERLGQFFGGIPVFSGDLTRQVDRGQTVSMFGSLQLGIDIDPVPSIEAAAARAVIEGRTGARLPADGQPTLVVLPLDEGGYRLAWRAEARTDTDVRQCFVDAMSGRLLLEYSDLETQQARDVGAIHVVDLRGDLGRVSGAVRREIVLGRGDASGAGGADLADEAVASARRYVAATYDFYLRRFGRRGLDGRDTPITAVVHPVKREAWGTLEPRYGVYFVSSFWDGRIAVLGEGLPAGVTLEGRSWANGAAAIDLVAHELTHGVVGSSSRLIYRNESGALAEAFADVMATEVEFSAQPTGKEPMAADYLIGEDSVSGGVRSLENPSALGNPDHYDQRYAGADDNGGVHVNSTIASHAYYLAVEGGTNRTSGAVVEGVGAARRDQVARVFFRAFVYMLPSGASFADARAATIQSARDLDGAGGVVERAVAGAWNAVGVR